MLIQSIKNRVLVLSIMPVAILGLILFIIIQQQVNQLHVEQINSSRHMLIEDQKDKLKEFIQAAISLTQQMYDTDETPDRAIDLLKNISFGKSGYIFGYDSNAVRVFSGSSPAGVGDSYYDLKDANGVYLIRELIKAGKKNKLAVGDNYTAYHFPKPGNTIASEKLSYSAFFPKWELMIGVGVYVDEIDAKLKLVEAEISATKNALITAVGIATAVIAALLSFIALILIKTITHPINTISSSIEKLSSGDGDLTARLDTKVVKEMAVLSNNMNEFLNWLHSMISDIRNITGVVEGDTKQLAYSAEDLKNNCVEQHQYTDQVASAATEMSAASSQVASHAEEAAKAANAASQYSQKALRQMSESSAAMVALNNDVNNASDVIKQVGIDVEKISGILQVIENIAEQTNLLALNAAIEAARAGEQGRGFAVVADEVRDLASKTQGSTLEIQQMITTLQQGAKNAVSAMTTSIERSELTTNKLVEAETSLNHISSSIEQISTMNEQISTAAEQQNVVSEDISTRIVEVSVKTERSRELSETNESIAESLSDKTNQLENIIGQFKL